MTSDAVASATDRDEQVVGTGELDGRDDVGHPGAADDERRAPVDHAVPDFAGGLVAGINGTQQLRRFLKKNFLIQDVGTGLIKMSYLGNAGWRFNRFSTACIATFPSEIPFW